MGCLPLGLLAVDELLEDGDNPGERSKVRIELSPDEFGSLAKLFVEVLAVGDGTHSSAEDGLDNPAVERLQGVGIRGPERVGQLLRGVGDVASEGLAGEIETAVALTR